MIESEQRSRCQDTARCVQYGMVEFLMIRELARPTEVRFVGWSKEVELGLWVAHGYITSLAARTDTLKGILETVQEQQQVRDSEEAARQLLKEEDPLKKKVKGRVDALTKKIAGWEELWEQDKEAKASNLRDRDRERKQSEITARTLVLPMIFLL